MTVLKFIVGTILVVAGIAAAAIIVYAIMLSLGWSEFKLLGWKTGDTLDYMFAGYITIVGGVGLGAIITLGGLITGGIDD